MFIGCTRWTFGRGWKERISTVRSLSRPQIIPEQATGDNDGKNPPHVLWNPLREHCRPATTLLNGVVYLSFASHGDNGRTTAGCSATTQPT